jgi:hypothetical protein
MGKHSTAQIITRIVPIGPDGQVESSPVQSDASQLTLLSMPPTDTPLGPAQARLAQQASAATGKTKAKTTTKTAKTTAAKRNSRTATKVIPMETTVPESHDAYPDASRLENLEEAIARLNSQSQHVRHTLEELQKLSEALPKPPRALEMPDFGRRRLAIWEAEPIDQALTLQEAQKRHQAEIPIAPPANSRCSYPADPTPRPPCPNYASATYPTAVLPIDSAASGGAGLELAIDWLTFGQAVEPAFADSAKIRGQGDRWHVVAGGGDRAALVGWDGGGVCACFGLGFASHDVGAWGLCGLFGFLSAGFAH